MKEDTLPKDTLPEGEELTPADGSEGGSEGGKGVKDVLSKMLGKEFPDEETALKSVKDTYDHVGKVGQEKKELERQLSELSKESREAPAGDNNKNDEEIASIKKQLQDMTFYAENPEYKAYDKLIKRFGENPAEVIENEEFQELFQKVKSAEEQDKSKSVLQSNPRLAKTQDKIEDAVKSVNEGNFEKGKKSAIGAVLDAYNE